MVCVRAIAGGLVVALTTGSVSAQPVTESALWSDNLSEYADQRAAEGAHATAAEFYFRAYDRLTTQPGPDRFIGAAHEPLEKGILAAAETQQLEPARVEFLCEADLRLVRHARLLGGAERLTPEAVAVIRGARTRVHARLRAVDAICPGPAPDGPASTRVDFLSTYPHGYVLDNRIIEPGALARATAITAPLVPLDLPRRAGGSRVWTNLGVALIASGILVLGLGAGLASRERDASAALTIVAGATAFTAGFPMLIIGDKRRRAAALAVTPRGLSLSF